jgi:hypothetical protein
MKPSPDTGREIATEKNGINAQLNKLNIMTMMKKCTVSGEVLELHRIVIAVPTDQELAYAIMSTLPLDRQNIR